MKLEQFLEELEVFVTGWQKETKTITYTVSKAKGIITVIAAHHFPDTISCERAYQNTKIDFDEVQQYFKVLQSRYSYLYLKTNLIDENTAKHYDNVYNAGLNETIKKAWRSSDYTIVSAISFKYPAK